MKISLSCTIFAAVVTSATVPARASMFSVGGNGSVTTPYLRIGLASDVTNFAAGPRAAFLSV